MSVCMRVGGYVFLAMPIFGTKLLIVTERECVTAAQRPVA